MVLVVAMGSRFVRTKKPVPGAVAALGLAAAAYNIMKWREWS